MPPLCRPALKRTASTLPVHGFPGGCCKSIGVGHPQAHHLYPTEVKIQQGFALMPSTSRSTMACEAARAILTCVVFNSGHETRAAPGSRCSKLLCCSGDLDLQQGTLMWSLNRHGLCTSVKHRECRAVEIYDLLQQSWLYGHANSCLPTWSEDIETKLCTMLYVTPMHDFKHFIIHNTS